MEDMNQELAWAAYEKHLPVANELPEDQVKEYRLDPDLAINNVTQGMQVVDKHEADIAEHLPQISLEELRSLPSLALAVKTSALRAQHAAPGPVSKKAMMTEGWGLRNTLLPVVQGLTRTGVLPEEVYKKIRRGRGLRDMAEDCVALAHVFRDYQDAVAGKHSVDPEVIARAELVGSWLLQNLRKRTAPRKGMQPKVPELDIRNRMATLLVERYNMLRVVAYYFYQDDFDKVAPPLQSRMVRRAAVAPEPEPEPAE